MLYCKSAAYSTVSSFHNRDSLKADMTETETNQNEAGDSQKPEQVEQAKAMEMEAKEAVETVKEEAENDLKKEFPFAEPTVLKGRNF